jgi:hypothetical protein
VILAGPAGSFFVGNFIAVARSPSGAWCRHSDLNRGPTDYESVALPLSYVGIAERAIQNPAADCNMPRRGALSIGAFARPVRLLKAIRS